MIEGSFFWPVSLSVDDSVSCVAPSDFTRNSPLAGIELQRVKDRNGVEGVRVLLQEQDGRTTALWERHLDMEPFATPIGTGIDLNEPADFVRNTFTLGEDGLHADIDVTDSRGRHLVARINSDRAWTGSRFPAPAAAGIVEPNAFFIPYLTTFDFLTEPIEHEVTYDGERCHLRKLPFLWRRRRALAQKGAIATTVINLLKDGEKPLRGDHPFAKAALDGYLHQVRVPSRAGNVVCAFHPPLPPADDPDVAGEYRWMLAVKGDRVAAGQLTIVSDDDGIDVEWTVEVGWANTKEPRFKPLLTTLVRPLTRWPLRYSWSGRMTWPDDHALVNGRWTNAKPIRQPEDPGRKSKKTRKSLRKR